MECAPCSFECQQLGVIKVSSWAELDVDFCASPGPAVSEPLIRCEPIAAVALGFLLGGLISAFPSRPGALRGEPPESHVAGL